MLDNDHVGDCVAAAAFHAQQLFEFDARDTTTAFTTAECLDMYAAISGYDPADPTTDTGARLQDGLEYWRTVGVGGYRITAFAQIDHTDLALVKTCIADFGVVYTGMNVPASAMRQLHAGQRWDIVAATAILGGHCVPLTGYDPGWLTCVTWGQPQPMSTAFYLRYVDETWVPISPDWVSRTGRTPSGLDATAANAEYQRLTGDVATPFPTEPGEPPATDPDSALAAAMHRWLTVKHL